MADTQKFPCNGKRLELNDEPFRRLVAEVIQKYSRTLQRLADGDAK
jgi:hypothetical protein